MHLQASYIFHRYEKRTNLGKKGVEPCALACMAAVGGNVTNLAALFCRCEKTINLRPQHFPGKPLS
ncbi:hypothetical protein N7452_002080 [Penicillium brevicompactum]|uniref:Uncharacterized protein n=1 Tax=Penicillium brevicompactum TaxID=5074 RepID=A0A9W9R3Y1_PENBR|nr:hypothetical protein N7452_002080 [Penicillium brevicompactum]